MAVAYAELPNSPTESIGSESPTAQRLLSCDWVDRYEVAEELLYKTYPYHDQTNMICRTTDIAPFDTKPLEETPGDPTKATWDKAVITANYSVLQGGERDPSDPGQTNPMKLRTFEESIDPTLEFLTIDQQKFWWHDRKPDTSDLQTELVTGQEAPVQLLAYFDWVLEYKDVQVLPDFGPYIGKINDGPVTSQTLGYTFNSETLLFHPPAMRRTIFQLPGGLWTPGWNLRIVFSYRDNTWNRFYWSNYEKYQPKYVGEPNPILGPWNVIVPDGKSTPLELYEKIDMTPLLPPPEDP